jgi:hypothetical protein
MTDDHDSHQTREHNGNAAANSVDFDYSLVAHELGEPDDSPDEMSPEFPAQLGAVLEWIRAGNRAKSIAIRVQVICYLITPKGQKSEEAFAAELGVTKAAISKEAVEFQKKFGYKAPTMRSEQARATFSAVCTQSHQKRKSNSRSSRTTSANTIGEPNNSKFSVWEMGRRLSKQLLAAGGCSSEQKA